MQTQCVRVPLKPGTTQKFVDWVHAVADRRAEMLHAMAREGVHFEALMLDKNPAGDALLFFMQAQDLIAAQQAFATSELPIDVETRGIIEACWDTGAAASLDVLLALGPSD